MLSLVGWAGWCGYHLASQAKVESVKGGVHGIVVMLWALIAWLATV